MTTNPPRLVIIDDEPKLAGVVTMIARDAYPNHRELVIESVVTAEAAVLAIRRISEQKERAIVVISDFHLPPSTVSGMDLLAEVKRRLPAAKRVLMTGKDKSELLEALDDAKLDAFVAKPFTFEHMQSLIRQLVSEVADGAAETMTA
jgi:two-component system OmpR family response regulator